MMIHAMMYINYCKRKTQIRGAMARRYFERTSARTFHLNRKTQTYNFRIVFISHELLQTKIQHQSEIRIPLIKTTEMTKESDRKSKQLFFIKILVIWASFAWIWIIHYCWVQDMRYVRQFSFFAINFEGDIGPKKRLDKTYLAKFRFLHKVQVFYMKHLILSGFCYD